jgi:hypothetical protein
MALSLVTASTTASPSYSHSGIDMGTFYGGVQPGPRTVQAAVTDAECEVASCGYTNFEMDWDDSNFSSMNSYLPVQDHRFYHQYAAHGTFYGELSADDNLGNWAVWTNMTFICANDICGGY